MKYPGKKESTFLHRLHASACSGVSKMVSTGRQIKYRPYSVGSSVGKESNTPQPRTLPSTIDSLQQEAHLEAKTRSRKRYLRRRTFNMLSSSQSNATKIPPETIKEPTSRYTFPVPRYTHSSIGPQGQVSIPHPISTSHPNPSHPSLSHP